MSGSGAGGGRGIARREQIASALAPVAAAAAATGRFGGPLDALDGQIDAGQASEQAGSLGKRHRRRLRR